MSVQPRLYELGYLLAPLIASESTSEEVARIKKILGDNIQSEGLPTMQRLAYTISKHIGSNRHEFDDAYFGWIKFETTPEQLSSIKNELEKLEMIVRYLLIKTEIIKTNLERASHDVATEDDVPVSEKIVDEHTQESVDTPSTDTVVASEILDAPEDIAVKESDRNAQLDKEIDDLLERGV